MWIIYSLKQKSVWGKKGDKYSDYVINSGVGKLLWRQMQISLIKMHNPQLWTDNTRHTTFSNLIMAFNNANIEYFRQYQNFQRP